MVTRGKPEATADEMAEQARERSDESPDGTPLSRRAPSGACTMLEEHAGNVALIASISRARRAMFLARPPLVFPVRG